MEAFLTAFVGFGTLAVALTSALVAAQRRLAVDEDPRLDEVEAMLPGTNCGACGSPGCRAFAAELLAGRAAPAGCTVSTAAARQGLADHLGVDVGVAVQRVARLACAGGSNVARSRARYRGLRSCAAEATVSGGSKGCAFGCLGLGDCARACHFDAITLDAHDLPIVDESRCTACGDCVTACPKDLLSLQPRRARLWVACASPLLGDEALLHCDVGCNACGRCAADEPALIQMRAGLPVVDAGRPHPTDRAIQRCPTGAIVWLDHGRRVRGDAALPILRQRPRPRAET
ncbi:MAG: 4Fe-4S binding protein [Myxococcales bacterium]|nr:4Fe-4S binding protein [Myxococcales bacterium]